MMKSLTQLKWSCRRGTLELDKLLLLYVEQHYLNASEIEKQLFEDLLNHQDSELLDFFFNKQLPTDKRLSTIVKKIRNLSVI